MSTWKVTLCAGSELAKHGKLSTVVAGDEFKIAADGTLVFMNRRSTEADIKVYEERFYSEIESFAAGTWLRVQKTS